MPDWFADEAFWAEVYPFEFPPPVIDAGVAQVEKAVALSGVSGGHALDLGCGPGRHAIPLARRGFRVTAVDLSPFHLARARDHAAAARVDVEFVQSDMRAFARADTFDLALSIFTSFGYFEDPVDDRRVLDNVRRSLRPGGALVMDVASKERLARVLHPTLSQRTADGALLVQRHEIVDDWTRVRNEWTVVRDGRARTFEFCLRVYSGQELEALLGAVGFASVRLCGALDGRPYDLEAERLVAVAVR
jgi:SAM-dependent methyltransferase